MKHHLILFFTIFLLVSLDYAYASESNTITLYPVADSCVRDNSPSYNYGDKRLLEVYNWKRDGDKGYSSYAYLMFYLSEIPHNSTIESANLAIYVSYLDASLIGKVYHCPDSSWKEFEINWKNAPDFNTDQISSILLNNSKEFYSFNVTESTIKAIDKNIDKITFVITTEEIQNLRGFSIISKEGGLKQQIPKLNIIYSTTQKIEEKPVSNDDTFTENETETDNTYAPTITESDIKSQTTTEKKASTPIKESTIKANQSSLEQNYFAILFSRFDLITILSITLISGIIIFGVITKYVVRPKLSINKLSKKKFKQKIIATESQKVNICEDCGEKLRPLKFTNKNVCPNCQRVYNRDRVK